MDCKIFKYEVRRDNKIKKEVSNRIFIPVISAVNQKGLEFKDFLEGVPYDESHFLDKRERVEWWVYCKVISNMRPFFSYTDFENIGADFIRGGTYIEGLIGFFLFTSRNISKVSPDMVLKRITSNLLCLNMQLEFIGDNKIRFIIKVDEEYEHPPEFAYGNKGIIRELGNKIGLKECKVDMQFVPQGAVYDMTWSKEGLLFKIKRGIRWIFNINKAFWELTDSHEELLKEYEELEDYKKNLEIKVSERTAELKKAHDQLSETINLLRETQKVQSRFFANISHEFRTPLTLILGPVKELLEKTSDKKIKGELTVVHKNAYKLLVLVNQLLDISKLESGNMKLKTSPRDIISLLKTLLKSFCSYAERKNITLLFNSKDEEISVYLDQDKIEKIITNILSNAFKFTQEGGRIEIEVCKDERYVRIIISDNGIGIPSENLPKIFDRFYQVDGSVTREQEGTGIGLALTKELVELHKGKIEVASEEYKGTIFNIYIPLGTNHLKAEEIIEEEEAERESFPSVADPNLINGKMSDRPKTINDLSLESAAKTNNQFLYDTEKPLLLIVEDNIDVRKYIIGIMKSNYNIIEAADGMEGWNKSIDIIPDLIISDIMMPKMDGFKLCGKLKTNERTSHIPVILLTAKATSRDKVEGYEIGADDYIMKPFEPDELLARIKNLIEQRNRIHEYFKKHGLFEIEGKNITPVDKRFLQKISAIINEHISDTSFGVNSLANNMAVSRSLLLKKTEALIGEPPSELIKSTRLNRAAKLIESKYGNISEISLEVGFNNPSYFAECFKKKFGISPSQFH